jgi:choloylglycine hydrolase
MVIVAVLALSLAAGFGSGIARACSVFQIVDGEAVVTGYNFDWFKPISAHAFVNPRGADKVALAVGGDKQAAWTSKYGSVTFSGFGREFPFCGMNEVGLVVVQAWLGSTTYSELDERPSLGELQWIQYQLDTAGSVADVIASDTQIRISKHTLAPLHFFVSDHSGETAIIEFIHGKMSVSSGKRMPVKVMVNAPYQQCLVDLESGEKTRFTEGAGMTQLWRPGSQSPVSYAFTTLEHLRRDGTRWSVVFNSESGEIHYQVTGAVKFDKFDTSDLSYACGDNDIQLCISNGHCGEGSGFTAFDADTDRALVLANGAVIPNADPNIFEAMAGYSAAAGCHQ